MGNIKTTITLSDNKFKSCGDLGVNIQHLLTTEINQIKTVNTFEDILYSELIDVTSRKTLSSYPTLKLMYGRYKLGFQGLISGSNFDYYKINDFISLVGDYWVDLIEQVVPSTTIWGSTIKYGNTIFDSNKFKYKRYSLITCIEPNDITYPSPTKGHNNNVGVTINNVNKKEYNGIDCLKPEVEVTICNLVILKQLNFGSEFIGSVKIIGETPNMDDGDIIIIGG